MGAAVYPAAEGDEEAWEAFEGDDGPKPEPGTVAIADGAFAYVSVSEAAFDRLVVRFLRTLVDGAAAENRPETHESWWAEFVTWAQTIEARTASADRAESRDMQITDRPYNPIGDDFETVWRFLQQDYADRGSFVWLFSRLGDWKYGLFSEQKYFPSFFRKHAHLWVDGFDQPRGFVLSENGDEVFFVFTALGYDYLAPRILDWTVEHWRGRHASLIAEVSEMQGEAIAALESRGFHCKGEAALTREYDPAAYRDDPVRLPPDYRIVPMVERTDWRAKLLLYRNGFSGVNEVTDFDLLRSEYQRESPAYDPELDLSVLTPDGQHVATCVGFHDPGGSVAEVEKVCTHSAFRRLGLAEAVIRECLRRLDARGIRRAYITAYGPEASALYEKLGPIRRWRWFHYVLEG